MSMPFNLADGVTYGNITWVGLAEFKNKITYIKDNLNSDITKIKTALGDSAWMKTQEDSINTKLAALKTTYQSTKVKSPKVSTADQEMNYMKNQIQVASGSNGE